MIGKAVCVTGGSGYIASWLIKLLLRHGYTVIASVRDPCDLKKTAHLLELDGAEERLHLYRADLLEEGSFDSAVRGCVGVFHTASPVSFDVADPQGQVEVVDPAVNGTLNVLKSCAKSPSVKRVIVTSSIASMFYTGKPSTEDTVADETWFSDPVWYQLSKTLAESAAWEFAKENNIDLVTINPGFVNGPFLQPTPTFSAEMVLNLVNGTEQKQQHSYYYWSVDVRDVAEAHVKAFETESAHGRYCLVGSNADFPQVLQIIHQLYPTIDLPNNGITNVPVLKASKKKAEEGLGMKFMPLEVTLRDTIECLKERGFLSF
ncbi:Phenylacetaldehyde reductase [Linum perenne]